MFLHFNFEDYRGNYFGKPKPNSEGSEEFSYSRVVPPGNLSYFYSGEDSSEAAADQE